MTTGKLSLTLCCTAILLASLPKAKERQPAAACRSRQEPNRPATCPANRPCRLHAGTHASARSSAGRGLRTAVRYLHGDGPADDVQDNHGARYRMSARSAAAKRRRLPNGGRKRRWLAALQPWSCLNGDGDAGLSGLPHDL